MYIKELTKLVPATFEYEYIDEDGTEKKKQIDLKLRRMSFSTVTDKLDVLKEAKNGKTRAMAEILVEVIAEWNIYSDEEETEMFPITVEWFISPECPGEFAAQLSECVFERIGGNPQKAASLPNGSEPEARSTAAETA